MTAVKVAIVLDYEDYWRQRSKRHKEFEVCK